MLQLQLHLAMFTLLISDSGKKQLQFYTLDFKLNFKKLLEQIMTIYSY